MRGKEEGARGKRNKQDAHIVLKKKKVKISNTAKEVWDVYL